MSKWKEAANDDADALPVLTVDEVCKRWRCTRRTVMDAIKAGKLVAFKLGARTHRIALSEIIRYETTKAA